MTEPHDKKFIACNYIEGTNVASEGSVCYVVGTSGMAERLNVLVRSRGGRWIKKWESFKRLDNFRAKTIPPEHPRFHDKRIRDYSGSNGMLETDLKWFKQIKALRG